MSENAAQNKGKRFADDLRRIREHRGVSIDELHEETKIPRGLIASFEESGLLDHPMFNRVYLRSFVRTYARVVDISPAFTLRALEEVLDGTYKGRLAEEYLGQTEPAEESEEPDRGETEPAGEADERGGEEKAAAAEGASEEEGRAEAEEAAVSPEEEEAEPTAAEERKDAPEPSPSEEREEKREVAGAAAGAAAAGPAQTEGRPQRRESRSQRPRRSHDGDTSARRQGIYLGAALLAIALGGWLLFSVLSGDSTSDVEDGQAGAVAADTVAEEDTASAAEAPAEPAEPVDIGEEMDFRVVAAQGPIRELRVRVDNDVRRPYWIEEGEEQTFSAQNQITFSPPVEATNEQPIEMMELELEGYPYPTTERDDQGQIVVTRDRAQSYLDSLAAQQ